jgi:hypothetical protein
MKELSTEEKAEAWDKFYDTIEESSCDSELNFNERHLAQTILSLLNTAKRSI